MPKGGTTTKSPGRPLLATVKQAGLAPSRRNPCPWRPPRVPRSTPWPGRGSASACRAWNWRAKARLGRPLPCIQGNALVSGVTRPDAIARRVDEHAW